MENINRIDTIEYLADIKKSETRAKARQKELKENDVKLLKETSAFLGYIEGASLEDVCSLFNIDIDTFKYKLKKIKENGVKGLMDLRNNNGSHNEKKITKEIGQRIVEMKVLKPEISTREIAKKLHEQDMTEVSHTIVNNYLNEVGMNEYKGSSYRGNFFPL